MALICEHQLPEGQCSICNPSDPAKTFEELRKIQDEQLFKKKISEYEHPQYMPLRKKYFSELVAGNEGMLKARHKVQLRDGDLLHPECGVGWYKLIADALTKIKAETNAMEFKDYRVRFLQIKEKFGGLRMYFNIRHKDSQEDYPFHEQDSIPEGLYAAINPHIRVAEQIARVSCEVCGDAGTTQDCGGWIRTICERHGEAYKKIRG
jgi:hypothetical protein